MAIDLALNEGNIDFICPKFPYYGICQNFRNIAPKYGFIERYKDEKKAITKISKEEWHFRYVGYPHSKIITEKEYVGLAHCHFATRNLRRNWAKGGLRTMIDKIIMLLLSFAIAVIALKIQS